MHDNAPSDWSSDKNFPSLKISLAAYISTYSVQGALLSYMIVPICMVQRSVSRIIRMLECSIVFEETTTKIIRKPKKESILGENYLKFIEDIIFLHIKLTMEWDKVKYFNSLAKFCNDLIASSAKMIGHVLSKMGK